MDKVKSGVEFWNLEEDEILAALDSFEDSGDSGTDGEIEPDDPIVREVGRLISEYSARFDEYCANEEEIPESIFTYEPAITIERVAYGIFADAVHDALQAEDDGEDDE